VSLAQALLEPHRSYVNEIQPLLAAGAIKGMAHITGGGLPGNVSRVIPEGLTAEIDATTWSLPPIFGYVIERGHIDLAEAYRVFNMGIGFVVIAAPDLADLVLDRIPGSMSIGSIASGSGSDRVRITGLTT
jgi:phosphoribosylformylglycinamidine cyclo-ligase